MTPEERLSALLAADRPASPDHVFSARVAERVARRRAWATVAGITPWAIVLAVLGWALHPILGDVVASVGPGLVLAAGAIATLWALAWMGRGLGVVLGRR